MDYEDDRLRDGERCRDDSFLVRPRITIINLTVSMREWDVVLAPYKRDLFEKRGALLQVAILKTSMDSYRRVIPICTICDLPVHSNKV